MRNEPVNYSSDEPNHHHQGVFGNNGSNNYNNHYGINFGGHQHQSSGEPASSSPSTMYHDNDDVNDIVISSSSVSGSAGVRGRRINGANGGAHGGATNNNDDEPANKVLDIVEEYYKQLLEKLRNHLMLENVIRDEFAFTTFYDQLFEQLVQKLETMPPAAAPNDSAAQYDSLIKQAKFHLMTKYKDELFSFHDEQHKLTPKAQQYQEMTREKSQMFFLRNEVDNGGELFDSIDQEQDDQLRRRNEQMAEVSLEKKAEDVNLEAEIQEKEKVFVPMWRRIIIFLSAFFPILTWLPEYRNQWMDKLKNDVIAGITVGAMLIPQGMGYAMIVGTPPIYGLYASLIPLFVYSFTGTSRQLAMGPTALCSIVLADGLRKLTVKPEAGSELFIAYALLFGVVIGSVQLICGILRLGYLVNFMSYPVLSGFTSASAIIILFSQLNYLLGLHMPQDTRVHASIRNLAIAVRDIHVPSLLLGLCCLVFLLVFEKAHFSFKRQRKVKLFGREFNVPRHYSLSKIPGVLALVAVAIISMSILKKITNSLDEHNHTVKGIKIVGNVPSGLPSIGLPHLKEATAKTTFRELITLCIPIGLVGYLEGISIGKFYALQNGYELDYNQELIAIGASNLIGSWIKVFPGSGSMPRTVVNANAGARTQFSGFISGICMILTLLFLTPLTYYLPKPALAAIIMYSCKKIFDYEQMFFTYKVKKRDFFLLFIAFFCTLFIGVAEGILIGIGASMALVIYRTTRPRFRKLGRVPGTNMYEESKKSKDLIDTPGVLIVRFDADLYFANVTYFRHRIEKLIRRAPWTVYAVVLDCSSINQSDSTAVGAFSDLKKFLDKTQIEIYTAGLKKSIKDVLKSGGVYNLFKKTCFPSLHEAVLRAEFSTRLRIAAMKDQAAKEASGIELVVDNGENGNAGSDDNSNSDNSNNNNSTIGHNTSTLHISGQHEIKSEPRRNQGLIALTDTEDHGIHVNISELRDQRNRGGPNTLNPDSPF